MGKRVLVADDSATIQRAFAMVFGSREDVSLVPARSLDDAVASARQGRPDLVIADANLGGRTGYELCTAIKSDAGLRGVPVYILASSHSPYDDGKGRSAGVDGHLTKPFESQALIDKVLEILARPTSIAATVTAPRAEPLAPTPQQARPAASPSLSPAFSASAARPSAFGSAPTPMRAEASNRLDDDDDYGEFKIERSSGSLRAPPGARPAASAPPAASARPPSGVGAAPTSFASAAATPAGGVVAGAAPTSFASTAPTPAAGLRPSLIPGARPGTTPGRLPYGPLTTPPPVASATRPAPVPSPPAPVPSPPPPSAPAPITAHGHGAPAGRTIMGLPAVAIPGVPVRPTSTPAGQPAPSPGMPGMRSPSTGPVPLQPVPAKEVPSAELRPVAPAPSAPQAPAVPFGSPAISARQQQVLEQKLDQKLAVISAKGPEYEAIARLSREIIEQVVWEVVPELAEVIIREHVERLAQTRK
jgi:CheY-like chemotaxis protein